MTIKLSDYEKGPDLDGDYSDALKAAQKRLAYVHFAHIIHNRRSMIVFEGWDASGKGGVIRRMVAEWDPRYFEVYPIGAPTMAEKERHFLWRFWRDLPGKRNISIFDRSWYGRVLVERVEGFATEAQWKRGYDEINEFEAQQIDSGTNLIKIFLHITQKTQDKRFADRLDTPEKRWKIGPDDFRNRARRDDYLKAYQDMFKHTDTRWAPWAVFDGNTKKPARIAIMNHVAEKLEADVPTDMPEVDPEVIRMAQKAFGYEAGK